MKEKLKPYIGLHIILLLYSAGGICAKYAANAEFLSLKFIFFYGIVILDLFLYAICWQQILKHMPLFVAYVNKSVVVIWGILWGYIFFSEDINWRNIVGALVIIAGVYLVVSDDYKVGIQK